MEARSELVAGELATELARRMADDGHDVLVIGAPLPDVRGQVVWSDAIRELLDRPGDHPILVVRAARGSGAEPAGDVA